TPATADIEHKSIGSTGIVPQRDFDSNFRVLIRGSISFEFFPIFSLLRPTRGLQIGEHLFLNPFAWELHRGYNGCSKRASGRQTGAQAQSPSTDGGTDPWQCSGQPGCDSGFRVAGRQPGMGAGAAILAGSGEQGVYLGYLAGAVCHQQ